MYKIRRGCPILGHKDRTHPPNSPIREAHPGAALDPPLQPEGDPAPFRPPVGARGGWSCAPTKTRQSRQDPHGPRSTPGTAASSPCFFPLPTPTTPPQQTKDTSQHNRYRQGGGCSSGSGGSRRPCTSSLAFSQGAGRAQPEWPRRTLSSGPAGSGLSTPGT